MRIQSFLKRIMLKTTPKPVWKRMLKSHYLKKLRSYRDNDEFEKIEPDMTVIRSLLGKGDFALDIGANFGFYSLFLSGIVGGSGQVYSIEPIPLTFEILSNNVERLGLDNVRLFNCGISDRAGSGTMEVPHFDSGNENYYMARIINGKEDSRLKQIKVSLRTLEDLVSEDARSIRFIKIDVEGHELNVIKGGINVIKTHMPPLFIEVSGDPDDLRSPAAELFALLRGLGYSAYLFDGNRLRERKGGDKSINYFFLPDERSKEIKSGQ